MVAGENLDLPVPLTVLTAEEQVITSVAGANVVVKTCYSDPSWVQRPFETHFEIARLSQYKVDEAQAQTIYGHGIYGGKGNREMIVWSSIAGLTWNSGPPGCEAVPPGYLYILGGIRRWERHLKAT